MILVVALLTASIQVEIDLGPLFRANAQRPGKVVCGISTVGYRFVGKEGQRFRYAGDTYVIPAEGWIELLADRNRTTYSIRGRSVQIDESPRDQFGFRTVVLPENERQEGDRP